MTEDADCKKKPFGDPTDQTCVYNVILSLRVRHIGLQEGAVDLLSTPSDKSQEWKAVIRYILVTHIDSYLSLYTHSLLLLVALGVYKDV